MGLADWFRTFCSNIQVQDGGTISDRYKRITRRLNTDFWTTTSETSSQPLCGVVWAEYGDGWIQRPRYGFRVAF